LWQLRINQTVFGNKGIVFTPKLKNPIVAILPDTTNVNPSNIAGYLTQVAQIQIGTAEIGQRYRLPNKQLRVLMLPNLINYQLKFTLATPVGNCKVQIWEGIPKASL
jgi:hypothetical protein